MKNLILSFVLAGSLNADVPALINYQGRLVDGVGNPVTGAKTFQLDVFDAQTAGTLIYQETLDDVTLDEDGAYSFQFGAGESRSQISTTVATGDGETSFFQKVLGQTPVGVISVTDGTTTFTSTDAVTGEEPFTFTYTASVNRLNLICNEPPAADVQYIATFRYAEVGISGALSSAAEHWMEVTIGGEKQTPRQRIVAVPFALRAGVADSLSSDGLIKDRFLKPERVGSSEVGVYLLPDSVKKIKKIEYWAKFYRPNDRSLISIRRMEKNSKKFYSFPNGFKDAGNHEVTHDTLIISKESDEVVYIGDDSTDHLSFVRHAGFESLTFDHEKYIYAVLHPYEDSGSSPRRFSPRVMNSVRLFFSVE